MALGDQLRGLFTNNPVNRVGPTGQPLMGGSNITDLLTRSAGGLLGVDMRSPEEKILAATAGIDRTTAAGQLEAIKTRLKFEKNPDTINSLGQQAVRLQSQLDTAAKTAELERRKKSNLENKAKKLEKDGFATEASQMRDPTLTLSQKNTIFNLVYTTEREKAELKEFGEQLRNNKNPYAQRIGILIGKDLFETIGEAKAALRSRSLDTSEIGSPTNTDYQLKDGTPIETVTVTAPDGSVTVQRIDVSTGETTPLDLKNVKRVSEDSKIKSLSPAATRAATAQLKTVIKAGGEQSDLISNLGDEKQEFIVAVAEEAERLSELKGENIEKVTVEAFDNIVSRISISDSNLLFGITKTTLKNKPPENNRQKPRGRAASENKNSSEIELSVDALNVLSGDE